MGRHKWRPEKTEGEDAVRLLVAARALTALWLSGRVQPIPATGVRKCLPDVALKLSRLPAHFIQLGEQFRQPSGSQFRHGVTSMIRALGTP